MARHDACAETGSEALELRFDTVADIGIVAVGWVSIAPHDVVLLVRRARAIEQRGLRQDNEWRVRDPARPGSGMRSGDLLHRATKVHGGGAPAGFGPPWNGPIQHPVHLERTKPIAEALELRAIQR